MLDIVTLFKVMTGRCQLTRLKFTRDGLYRKRQAFKKRSQIRSYPIVALLVAYEGLSATDQIGNIAMMS